MCVEITRDYFCVQPPLRHRIRALKLMRSYHFINTCTRTHTHIHTRWDVPRPALGASELWQERVEKCVRDLRAYNISYTLIIMQLGGEQCVNLRNLYASRAHTWYFIGAYLHTQRQHSLTRHIPVKNLQPWWGTVHPYRLRVELHTMYCGNWPGKGQRS